MLGERPILLYYVILCHIMFLYHFLRRRHEVFVIFLFLLCDFQQLILTHIIHVIHIIYVIHVFHVINDLLYTTGIAGLG